MRINRLARLGGVAAGALALFATLTPPASAEGVKSIVFQGTATVEVGLGFPVITGGTPGVNTTTPPSKKTPPITIKGGNDRAGRFASTVCVGTSVSAGKEPHKPTGVQAGTCFIQAAFRVTGYCGLSTGTGRGTATLTNTLPVNPGHVNRINFKFTWVDPGGGNLAILGNWWHGATEPATPEGDIVSFVKATPAPSGVPPTQSCVAKTQQDFLIAGTATLTHPKCLPGHNEPLPACALP